MSIEKKNKDHLKAHGGVSLVEKEFSPKSDDPLRFWTSHQTKNALVDLHLFADGEFENSHPSGKNAGNWGGAYSGRPQLIIELAPAIQARLSLASRDTVSLLMGSLRAWWRLFDAFENTHLPDGRQVSRVQSVADLNELHESLAHQSAMHPHFFNNFRSIVNDTRRLLKFPPLFWESPNSSDPVRTLIPDDQARELKTALKQNWERVRKTWAQNDAIREEAVRREAGELARALDEKGEYFLKNWMHFQRIQKKTGRTLPTSEQLLDGKDPATQCYHGLERRVMRSILFPTAEEADIAFHLALMNSGWNPTTVVNIDANFPFLVTTHPKNFNQLVLSVETKDEELTLQGTKPRAKGKLQFCMGLAKNLSSPPVIVGNYLKRFEPLREILMRNYEAAKEELATMQSANIDQKVLEKLYKKTQRLRQGCHSVWLYIDGRGNINWPDGFEWSRYGSNRDTYLDMVLEGLNARRADCRKTPIAKVTPSDFRDIYARWVYKQTGGNILAVMLALGHSRISSTVNYVENNIFATENDEHARRFMTHLLEELGKGRVDLTILAQLVRHGPMTPEMEARLNAYRKLMKSRIGTGCANPRHPPVDIDPKHVAGRLCGTHRCLNDCQNAKFLPESLDGIAMRVEELMAMLDHLPIETWLHSEFKNELDSGEYLLETLYPMDAVAAARKKWRGRITSGEHIVPGLGHITQFEETA